MMVDKGDSDDQLIDALKEENEKFREALKKVVQREREESQSRLPREARAHGVPNNTSSGADTSQLEAEIVRLNRLVKQQVF